MEHEDQVPTLPGYDGDRKLVGPLCKHNTLFHRTGPGQHMLWQIDR